MKSTRLQTPRQTDRLYCHILAEGKLSESEDDPAFFPLIGAATLYSTVFPLFHIQSFTSISNDATPTLQTFVPSIPHRSLQQSPFHSQILSILVSALLFFFIHIHRTSLCTSYLSSSSFCVNATSVHPLQMPALCRVVSVMSVHRLWTIYRECRPIVPRKRLKAS
jgi:hypothetical protein